MGYAVCKVARDSSGQWKGPGRKSRDLDSSPSLSLTILEMGIVLDTKFLSSPLPFLKFYGCSTGTVLRHGEE
jgi:hypothetical protein